MSAGNMVYGLYRVDVLARAGVYRHILVPDRLLMTELAIYGQFKQVPQVLWFRRIRTNIAAVFVVSLLVNVGMWFERFVIIVTSLHRDYLPANWADYRPTSIEVATLIGSFGLFFTLFLLFVRFLPVVAISEVKGVMDPKVARSAPPTAPIPAAVAAFEEV